MSSFALVLSSSLLVLTDSVEILTYTTSNPAPGVPSFVNCSDPTGCEINCNGDYSCYDTVVYCPDNATCTVTATGSEAVSIMLVDCGTNGICDITGRGDKSLFYVAVHAETSTKLTVTADGGYRSFHCDIYCPQNQTQPSCFARVRSDSSPYFTSDYVMRNSSLSIYVDSINDIEFQCDANTDWAALFEPGSDNSIFYYSNTNDPVCTWKPDTNYAQNDFFNTNSFICLDGYDTNIMNNKRCVPWDTDTVTSTEPTQLPSKLPTQLPTKLPTQLPSKLPTQLPTKLPTQLPSKLQTQLPTKLPTQLPSKLPTQLPTKLPTKLPTQLPSKTETTPPSAIPTKPPSTTSTLPTEFPTIVLSTSSTKVPSKQPTEVPTKQPTQLPSKSPAQTAPSPSPTQETKSPSEQPTQEPSKFPTQLTKYPSKSPTARPVMSKVIFATEAPTQKPQKEHGNVRTTVLNKKDDPYDDRDGRNAWKISNLIHKYVFWICLMITVIVFCIAIGCIYEYCIKKRRKAMIVVTQNEKPQLVEEAEYVQRNVVAIRAEQNNQNNDQKQEDRNPEVQLVEEECVQQHVQMELVHNIADGEGVTTGAVRVEDGAIIYDDAFIVRSDSDAYHRKHHTTETDERSSVNNVFENVRTHHTTVK